MKLREIRRLRFSGGLAVFVCAFLAVCVFIAFEVLDLDGSNLAHPFRESIIAAEATSADLDELLPQGPPAAEAQSGGSLSLDLPLPAELPEVGRSSGAAGLRARIAHALPRASLRREPSSSTALSDDPA